MLNHVCFQKRCIEVEIVERQDELMRGLMFRKVLPGNHGMLFVFQESRPYPFWMKNTFIPLDIIWLDANRRIVHIEENVPSCLKDPCPTYTPLQAALYVLEVNAGDVKRFGLKAGDTAAFQFSRPL